VKLICSCGRQRLSFTLGIIQKWGQQEAITYGSILFRYHFSEDLANADTEEQVQKLLRYHIEEEDLELIMGVGVAD